MCRANSMECTSLFVKIGINYLQATISMKLMEFAVLHTAAMKRGKRLCRKSLSFDTSHDYKFGAVSKDEVRVWLVGGGGGQGGRCQRNLYTTQRYDDTKYFCIKMGSSFAIISLITPSVNTQVMS